MGDSSTPTPTLATPWRADTWTTAPVEDLIAAYRMSAQSAEHPTTTGRVWRTEGGQGRADGGDPRLLEIIKSRRVDVLTYLAHLCDDCGQVPAGRLTGIATSNTARICGFCHQARVADTCAAAPTVADPGSPTGARAA